MLIDLVQVPMSLLIVAHHLVCFVCNAYATTMALRAFPWYVAGVTALELGSGGNCLVCLWPKRFTTTAFLVTMSLSNLAAAFCTWQWAAALPELPIGRCVEPALELASSLGHSDGCAVGCAVETFPRDVASVWSCAGAAGHSSAPPSSSCGKRRQFSCGAMMRRDHERRSPSACPLRVK